MIRRLLGILGRRTLLTFGLVTFLVGALLATVTVTPRFALTPRCNTGDPTRGAVRAVVGRASAMGSAFLALQGARYFPLRVHVQDQPRFLFDTPINKDVRLDRDELNRWLMDQTGSVSYNPYIRAILLMPYEWDVLNKFDQVATGFVPNEGVGAPGQHVAHIHTAHG